MPLYSLNSGRVLHEIISITSFGLTFRIGVLICKKFIEHDFRVIQINGFLGLIRSIVDVINDVLVGQGLKKWAHFEKISNQYQSSQVQSIPRK